jgi:hypothetical protein
VRAFASYLLAVHLIGAPCHPDYVLKQVLIIHGTSPSSVNIAEGARFGLLLLMRDTEIENGVWYALLRDVSQ